MCIHFIEDTIAEFYRIGFIHNSTISSIHE